MKKLSIEEKAKRYDEAIDVCRKLYNKAKADGYTSDIEDYEQIFPELKKSEDEKIRENIIATIHLYYGEPLEDEAKEMIAWLEKRCKNNMGISEATKQKLEDNLHKALEKETPESWNEFLDEQGEQKPAEYTLEQAAGIFLDALSNTPYNNKPITDAQVITKELLKFLSDGSSYNPNALNEQKPAWSEEDETTKNNISHIIRQYDKISKRENQPCYYVGDCLLWMQNIKERVLPQAKQKWSEEDEDYYDAIITKLEVTKDDALLTDNQMEFLKSLKDRVQSQPKQEWSEEDEKQIRQIERIVKDAGCTKTLQEKISNWLKSLRPQNTWKPSDEQMRALESIFAKHGAYNDDLLSLISDLKKLMEE